MRSPLRIYLTSVVALAAGLAFGARALAETDPLPPWNDGAAKQAIIAFVKETTEQGSPKFLVLLEMTYEQGHNSSARDHGLCCATLRRRGILLYPELRAGSAPPFMGGRTSSPPWLRARREAKRPPRPRRRPPESNLTVRAECGRVK
jgi:hypothetical protein